MRADHYGRCAAYPALARLLGSDQVLVGPLSSAELAAVIEHPAQRVGLRVEPALTEALVADAGTEPGVLPLLSTCLLELWGAREDGRLTLGRLPRQRRPAGRHRPARRGHLRRRSTRIARTSPGRSCCASRARARAPSSSAVVSRSTSSTPTRDPVLGEVLAHADRARAC